MGRTSVEVDTPPVLLPRPGVPDRDERDEEAGRWTTLGSWRFAASTASIAVARNCVGEAMLAQVGAQLAGDIQLVASELASNAVSHASSEFVVSALVDPTTVRLEVADGSTEHPVRREPAQYETSGRGYRIIEALSARWGVCDFAFGKVIWVEFSLA